MHNVLIYRHQLFKGSEPFIMLQASHLTSFHPVFVGRESFSDPPGWAETYIFNKKKYLTRETIWQVLTRDPKPYLNILPSIKFHLLHAHFGVDGLYALNIAKKLNVPMLTTFHGFDVTVKKKDLLRSRKISWIHYALFQQKLFDEGNFFLAVSNHIRDNAIQLGVPENKIITHYIGVDNDRIKPDKSQIRDEFIILHVARLVEKKGTEYLIRAFKLISEKHRDVKLVIIGDGPLKEKLQCLSESLGLTSHIRFLGALPHNEVLKWMSRSSIFCLPSITATSGDSEGLPIVLLEAAASGVPLIGTDHGGIPEALEDGISGYLVPEKSIVELAERIDVLIEQPSLRDNMGRAARSIVEDRFNIRKQTKKLEKIYEELL